jgi:hypothetical protein
MEITYARRVDYVRKLVAALFAICGAGFVLSVRRVDWLQGTLRRDPGAWVWGAWIFGIGMQLCFVVAIGLIIEYVMRNWRRPPLKFKQFAVAGMLAVIVYSVIVAGLFSTADRSPHKGPARQSQVDDGRAMR